MISFILFLLPLVLTTCILWSSELSGRHGNTRYIAIATAVVFPLLCSKAILYFSLPANNWGEGAIFFNMIVSMVIVLLTMFTLSLCDSKTQESTYNAPLSWGMKVGITALFSLFVGVILALILTSTGIFKSADFRALADIEEVTQFEPSNVMVDQSQSRSVDQLLAAKTAKALLGERIGLGSRFEFDTFHIQSLNGQLYWVAPLVHKRFMGWVESATTPGYAIVNASDTQDSRLVLDTHPINVGAKGFHFGTNVHRIIYQGGADQYRRGKAVLELRDGDLKPFWVVPLIESTIGFSGVTVVKVAVVDAGNGDLVVYDMNAIPVWIDRVFDESVSKRHIHDWGKFVGSWFNAHFVGNDVVTLTEGFQLTYTKDGRTVWYSGLQSSGSGQEASMGLALMDSRSGKITIYRRQGLTETTAMTVMDGAVQEAGYTSSHPQPYVIGGEVAYVSIMKDRNGNRQGFGIVAYNNRDAYGVGNTPEQARRAFLNRLLSGNAIGSIASGKTLASHTATVVRVTVLNDAVMLMLHNETSEDNDLQELIFLVSRESSVEAPLTRVGDTVAIRYAPIESSPQPITCFDNLLIRPSTPMCADVE
jgi:hypothetical protein